MLTIFGSIITPALIASIFALFFNARAEKRREFRKAALDQLEESRELVLSGVKAAAAYFSKPSDERTPALEAEVWLIERELRMNLSTLADRSGTGVAGEVEKMQNDFDLFVGELTGANFQQRDAEVDLAHIRRIAGLGADLRVSLANASHSDLRQALEKDPLDKVMRFFEFGDHFQPLADHKGNYLREAKK